MRAALTVCVVANLAAGVARADFRLWIETRQQAPIAADNAVATGSTTLYLWAKDLEPEEHRNWDFLSFNIGLDGPAQIVSIALYQAHSTEHGNRWTARVLGNPSPPTSRIDNCILSATGRIGITNPPIPDTITDPPLGIPGYDDATASVLLGEFGIAYAGPDPATLWLELGQYGISHSPFNAFENIYLGFGDAPLRYNDVNQRTELPEATIIPEPGSALMLVLVLAAARRNRSR